MDIQASATKHAQSYANAMHLGRDASTTAQACGEALAPHYLPNIFTLGQQSSMATRQEAIESTASHLKRFEKQGLGFDVRLKQLRVHPLSPGSAMCWMTWEIYPRNGQTPWDWENIYGYRKTTAGREGFELIVADNELSSLLERYPDFLQLG